MIHVAGDSSGRATLESEESDKVKNGAVSWRVPVSRVMIEVVELSIARGFDVNICDGHYDFALAAALITHRVSLANLSLEMGKMQSPKVDAAIIHPKRLIYPSRLTCPC